jgi:hypothetical protein
MASFPVSGSHFWSFPVSQNLERMKKIDKVEEVSSILRNFKAPEF